MHYSILYLVKHSDHWQTNAHHDTQLKQPIVNFVRHNPVDLVVEGSQVYLLDPENEAGSDEDENPVVNMHADQGAYHR